MGVHGTLFYHWLPNRRHLPETKREIDWNKSDINQAQRLLFRRARGGA